MERWSRLSARALQRLRIFELRAERFQSPRTGQPVDAVVLDTRDWVNVIGLTGDAEVVLIRQFRFGTAEVTLEIPGGIVDPGETPLQAARRELREETGYAASRWTPLGYTAPNPAFIRNHLHCFLAEGCRRVGEPQQDPGEHIEVELCQVARVDALMASGEIDHALVEVAFHKWALYRAGLQLADCAPSGDGGAP